MCARQSSSDSASKKEARDKQVAARRELEKQDAERRKRRIEVSLAAEQERKRRVMADQLHRCQDDERTAKARRVARLEAARACASEQAERAQEFLDECDLRARTRWFFSIDNQAHSCVVLDDSRFRRRRRRVRVAHRIRVH